MTRRLLLFAMALGLICALGVRLPVLVTPALADENWSITDEDENPAPTKPTTPPATNPTPATPATPSTASDDGNTGGAAAAPRVIPAKADIRGLLEECKYDEAETAYLQWASYWKEDDPSLIIPIERAMLLQMYKGGNFAALVALVEMGDPEAKNLLRAAVLAGGSGMPSEQFVAGIRFIGESKDVTALNMLRLTLYSEDAAVVNASIEALGNIGDKRIASELFGMFDEADAARSVALARALVKLGMGKQVHERFQPQLRFPQEGAKEKAALVLAALGNPTGWAVLDDMLTKKPEAYYPLVLTVLDMLPSEESTAYITEALAGNETEQLAALQSISLLPPTKINGTLLGLAQDQNRPVSVRVKAIDLMAKRKYSRAVKMVRELAANLDGETPEAKTGETPAVKAAGIKALPKYNLLAQQPTRELIRQRFASSQDDVALAARVALLQFALMEAAPKK